MLQIFDHYSNQEHESVTKFISNWGEKPWNDMNVPIYLAINNKEETNNGMQQADIIVYLPRKEHIKHVLINILNDEELNLLRKTFRGIGENVYEPAARNLESFANGGNPKSGLILYYWEAKEFE